MSESLAGFIFARLVPDPKAKTLNMQTGQVLRHLGDHILLLELNGASGPSHSQLIALKELVNPNVLLFSSAEQLQTWIDKQTPPAPPPVAETGALDPPEAVLPRKRTARARFVEEAVLPERSYPEPIARSGDD